MAGHAELETCQMSPDENSQYSVKASGKAGRDEARLARRRPLGGAAGGRASSVRLPAPTSSESLAVLLLDLPIYPICPHVDDPPCRARRDDDRRAPLPHVHHSEEPDAQRQDCERRR